MYYAKINKCDIANGEGIRVSLFVSGCRNRCKGCFQPETWDFTYGKPFDSDAEAEIISALANPSVRGLTILGGEPMEPENQPEVLSVLRLVKKTYPEKSIWLYTGNTYEELCGTHRTHTEYTEDILSLIDILVDGRFVEEEKKLGLIFRGSENQRIIDMKKTTEQGKIILWEGIKEDRKYDSKNKKNI